ncbi:MAG: hypothetical protein U9Q39_07765 [Pseudomonadota bacterium]|nr:hypothetical protein [Pseudomonadota bacterium]
MSQITPIELVLRCYGYRSGKYLVGHCIDLDIAVQAENIAELKHKMEQAVTSYMETVLNTENKSSIPALLKRQAPLSAKLKYHAINLLVAFQALRLKFFTFNEALPFHIGRNCSC